MGTLHINQIARVMTDPVARPTSSELTLAKCRVVFDSPRYNEQTRSWDNGKGFKVEVCVWGDKAELFAAEIAKGDEVFIAGRLETSEWEDQAGARQSKPVVQVDAFRPIRKVERRDRP